MPLTLLPAPQDSKSYLHLCWGHRGHWGCRGNKAWNITTDEFSIIQVLKFELLWCFEEKNWNHEISYWILVPFLSEAVEASLCHFFENLLMKLKFPKPPEPAMDHHSMKLMILLPFIAIYFRSFRYETPCTKLVFMS